MLIGEYPPVSLNTARWEIPTARGYPHFLTTWRAIQLSNAQKSVGKKSWLWFRYPTIFRCLSDISKNQKSESNYPTLFPFQSPTWFRGIRQSLLGGLGPMVQFWFNPWRSWWVKQCHLHHPPEKSPFFVGGMSWVVNMTLFYPHYWWLQYLVGVFQCCLCPAIFESPR